MFSCHGAKPSFMFPVSISRSHSVRTDVIVRSSVPKGHCPRSLQLLVCCLRRSITLGQTTTMMTAAGGAGHGFCCCGVAASN
jgi:hypothetical protein